MVGVFAKLNQWRLSLDRGKKNGMEMRKIMSNRGGKVKQPRI